MANPNTPKLKVKVFRIGRYAGPSVNDPQFETTSANEEVELSPAYAAYIVDHDNGEIVKDEKKAKAKSKKPKPSDADKEAAESE